MKAIPLRHEVREDRLQILAMAMREVHKHHRDKFDIRDWACGTTACACGWVPAIPGLGGYGFRLHTVMNGWREPVFEGDSGMYAVMRFFGLTQEEAAGLFVSTYYPQNKRRPVTPLQVAQKIEFYLRYGRGPTHEERPALTAKHLPVFGVTA